MMQLYYAANSCALACHIALEDAGAESDLIRVDFSANEQHGPAYRTIHPTRSHTSGH